MRKNVKKCVIKMWEKNACENFYINTHIILGENACEKTEKLKLCVLNTHGTGMYSKYCHPGFSIKLPMLKRTSNSFMPTFSVVCFYLYCTFLCSNRPVGRAVRAVRQALLWRGHWNIILVFSAYLEGVVSLSVLLLLCRTHVFSL